MNELFVGFIFLGATALFVALLIARKRRRLSVGLRIGQWVSGVLALLAGGYIWLFLHSLTIVTVTSNCPDYVGVVTAGNSHDVFLRMGQTDYFAFTDPREGSVDVQGRNGILASDGYVTTFGINRIDFRLERDCKGQASQTSLELE